MDHASLSAGQLSPIVSVPVPDTCATSHIDNADLIISILVVAGTGFDCDAVAEGQIDIALEKQGPLAFLLLRFQLEQREFYISAPFDALNTPSTLCFARVMERYSSSDGVALRIWTQDERSIIRTIRHTKLPAGVQAALLPVVRRQMRRGKPVEFRRGGELISRFMQRTKRTSLAFDGATIKARVT